MSKRLPSFFSVLSGAWLLIILALAIYDTRALFIQKKIQFDLMALLPESKTEAMKATSQLMEEANLMGRVLVFLGHPDAAISEAALETLRTELKQAFLPLKEQTSESIAQDYKTFFKMLHPYRAGFLAENDRAHLLEGKGSAIAQRALSEVMVPFSSFGPVRIKSDPFFLYPRFVVSLQPPSSFQRNEKGDVFIKADGKVWTLFKAKLTDSAFSLKTQKEISEKLTPILDRLQHNSGVDVLKTGAIFYAAAGSTQANAEISLMGVASILAVILVLLFVFKTVRPLFLAIAVISSGLIGGLAACLFVFGSVHALALIFGCSLVGVTVDYALHYFCASYKQENSTPFRVLNSLMPALLLSVLSSVLGYSLLSVAPFPGVQQMAILASLGLLCSFISVCVWGPYFINGSEEKTPPLGEKIQVYLDKVADFGQRKNIKLCLSVGLIALFVVGATVLTFEDDVRSFQPLDKQLKREEDRIQSMIKFDTASKFLTISGATLEDVLQREEKVRSELDKLQANNEIKSYHSLSTLIPSKKRQQENRQLIEEKLYKTQGPLFAESLGLKNDFNASALGFEAPLFVLEHATIESLPEGWRELVHMASEGAFVTRILLQGVTSTQSMEGLISQYEGISYIDPPGEYSKLFASYREIIMGLVLSVVLGITVILLMWRGFKIAAIIMSPIVLSLLSTVGIIGLIGSSFNLFHAMGLLLLLCIGIDYAFFLYWRKSTEGIVKKKDFLLLANGLAAVTTILSFGILSFSKTTAVHSFGITVFIGIALSFCVTTLFLGKGRG